MVNQRHIEHAIVRHSTGRLPVSRAATDAHGHDLAVDDVAVDADIHLIFHAMENHEENRYNERQRARPQQRASLSAKVHHIGNESYVDTIQEIAMALLPLLIGISDTSQVDAAHAALYQPVDSLLQIALSEIPVACKIVHFAIGNDTQCYLVTLLTIYLHQTIDGIVECGVAAHDNNGFVAIVDEHSNQSFDTGTRFALYEIILHIAVVEHALYLVALLAAVFSLRAI